MKIFDKFKGFADSLRKTRESLAKKFSSIFTGNKLDSDYLDKLEEILILSDISFQTATEIVESVKKDASGLKNITPEDLKNILRNEIKTMISKGFYDINLDKDKKIFMVVGVNGVGKTTTVGKLANYYKNAGKNVMMAACDTFRAAAREQLEIWGEKTGIMVVAGKENQDPASVAHDAVQKFKEKDFDVLIIDTAGRLHNKKHLMDELSKIKRVIAKTCGNGPDETWLVIDATIGQNSIVQIEQFKELVDISGIIITKMDGSARGGIIIDIIHRMNLPVRFIGTGEKPDNISEFSPEIFLEELF